MNIENYIEIIPHSLTRGTQLSTAFILLMQEKGGERFLPIILQEKENELVELALEKRLFPTIKAMLQLAQTLRIDFEFIVLSHDRDGLLKASVMFLQDNRYRSITYPAVTGVLIAIANRIPILVPRSVFNSQFSKQAAQGNVAIPIVAMSNELLREALQASIVDERFELSRLLTDELARRGLTP